MRRAIVKWVVIGLAAFLIVIQFIQPRRTNPPVIAAHTLQAHMEVPAQVQSILKRSCYDCHSSATVWPWYSHVAPVSWFVISHVNGGRRHINFQDWNAQVNTEKGKENLGRICNLVRDGSMPLASYRIMHKDSYLSAQDVNTLCAWSQKVGTPPDSGKKAN
ncbi:MAG TPA: heme-binding domain-containing protein [Candidatus Dormibacteraeota bacterium]|nr:heme-binding domain-containing protein [Candidatus Dormibacteraeota bacterium]